MPSKVSKVPLVCAWCGASYERYPSQVSPVCSRSCSAARSRSTTLREQFERYAARGEGCWSWTGTIRPDGYGVLGGEGRTNVRAHHLSWELHHGPIPDDRWVLHLCNNRRCVRPDHLELGTAKRNTDYMVACGRSRFHGKRNLTKAECDEIRKRYAEGKRQIDLAVAYGVHQTTISRVILHKTTAHS